MSVSGSSSQTCLYSIMFRKGGIQFHFTGNFMIPNGFDLIETTINPFGKYIFTSRSCEPISRMECFAEFLNFIHQRNVVTSLDATSWLINNETGKG